MYGRSSGRNRSSNYRHRRAGLKSRWLIIGLGLFVLCMVYYAMPSNSEPSHNAEYKHVIQLTNNDFLQAKLREAEYRPVDAVVQNEVIADSWVDKASQDYDDSEANDDLDFNIVVKTTVAEKVGGNLKIERASNTTMKYTTEPAVASNYSTTGRITLVPLNETTHNLIVNVTTSVSGKVNVTMVVKQLTDAVNDSLNELTTALPIGSKLGAIYGDKILKELKNITSAMVQENMGNISAVSENVEKLGNMTLLSEKVASLNISGVDLVGNIGDSQQNVINANVMLRTLGRDMPRVADDINSIENNKNVSSANLGIIKDAVKNITQMAKSLNIT